MSLVNTGLRRARIQAVKTSCSCALANAPRLDIPPWGQVSFDVIVNLHKEPGVFNEKVLVQFGEGEEETSEIMIGLTGEIVPRQNDTQANKAVAP